jgi:hypothetical protein
LLTAFAGSQKIVTAKIIEEVIQDLRLTWTSDSANFVWPERKGTAQFAPKAVRNMAGLGEARGRTEGRGQEEPLERFGNTRSIRVPGAADVVHNLGLKLDQPDVNGVAPERDFKPPPAKNVSIIAEAKDRRSGERVVEWGENAAVDVDSRGRDFFVSRHENARQRMNGPLVPAAFFAKMIQVLTDAMGPMASLVLQERIALLGESIEEFPIVRLPELVQAIKQEILSKALRRRFEAEIAEQVQEYSKLAVWRASAK